MAIIKLMQKLQKKVSDGKMTKEEALKEMNAIRDAIGLEPLEKLPKSWDPLFKKEVD